MIFRRRGDGIFQFERRSHDRLQNAVNTEADAEFFFVRLHVNVAGSALDRIGEHQVHELDDGSFVGSLLKLLELHFLLFRLDLDVARVADIVHRRHHRLQLFFFRSAVGFVDALDDGAFRSHHRLDVEAGHELDVVHGEDVGGIDHGDGERRAHAAERQNLIALGGFVWNQLDDGGIDFESKKD